MRRFIPLALLPSLFLCILPGQPPWPPGSPQTCQVLSLLSSSAQAVPSARTLFLQACLSLHCALWVSAQISPFQETIILAKPALTIALCPLMHFILLPRTTFSLDAHLPAQQQRLQEGRLVLPAEALDEAAGAHRPLSPCGCASAAARGGVCERLVLCILPLAWQTAGPAHHPRSTAQASSLTRAKALERGAVSGPGPSPSPGTGRQWGTRPRLGRALARGSVPRGKALPTSLP